jgi:unsaturated chondroitin disaccharide hydrolase
VRENGSIIQSALFRPNTGELIESFTHKGYSDMSTWARSQAWAILGYALAMKWVPGDLQFASVASRVADWWIAHVPTDYVAFWDFDDPQIPHTYRDTSATATAAAAAAALLKLSAVATDEGRRNRYREHSEATVRALVTGYLTPIRPGDTRPQCILTEGCYNVRRRWAMKHELLFGTYYLLESLYVLEGILDPAAI